MTDTNASWPNGVAQTEAPEVATSSADQPVDASTLQDGSVPLPRRGVLDRDWQKALIILLTLLAGVALLWVLWQVLSPILHTLVLFGLAAVLAFALSGPVHMLAARIGNGLVAILAVYVLVGIVAVAGLTLLAGPLVKSQGVM